eukprot:8453083-Alexandrium_andersonii.AAC.1
MRVHADYLPAQHCVKELGRSLQKPTHSSMAMLKHCARFLLGAVDLWHSYEVDPCQEGVVAF